MARNDSGGSVFGWFFGLVALAAILGSLYLSVGMSAKVLTDGAIGISAEHNSLDGLLLVVGFVALLLAGAGRK